MTTITLRAYNQYIKALVDQGNFDEAIFHCTSVLRSFPKCIETYQYLARSLLSSHRFTEASEVFLKILTVIPDDFDSHIGLSSVSENSHDLDKAIWHMEQAFEIRPSNPQAQEELLRLIGQRDGSAPAKIRLTRGALIRMYAKGELYAQAITETQALLQSEPDRADLKLLLARMYNLSSSPAEAAEICSEILKDLPYCYEANHIMFDLARQSGEVEQPSIYQQRLTELDPYFKFVDNNTHSVLDVPAEKIVLDQTAYSTLEIEQSETHDWESRIDIVSTSSNDAQSQTDNPAPVEASSPIPAFIEEAQEASSNEEAVSKSVPEDEIPDWIAKAGWIRAPEDEPDHEVTEESTILPELGAPDAVEQASLADEFPEWLKPLNPNKTATENGIFTSADENVTTGINSEVDNIPTLSADEIDSLISDEDISSLDFLNASLGDESVQSTTSSELGMEPIEPSEETSVEEVIPELPDWLKNLEMEEVDNNVFEANAQESALPVEQGTVENFESPDFINDLVNSDLVGQDENSEIPTTTQSFQPEERIPEMVIEEKWNELVPEPVQTEDMEKQVTTVPLEGGVREGQVPHATELPSWVKKVLSENVTVLPVPPIIPTDLNQVEIGSVENKVSTPSESIDELITDVQGLQHVEGAISEEVNADLMSWLKDINPEDEQKQGTSQPQPSGEVGELEIPEISYEHLVETPYAEIETTAIPEETPEESAFSGEPDTTNLNERLSELVGSQTEPPPLPAEPLAEVSMPIVEPEVSTLDEDKLRELVRLGNYAEVSSVISTISLPEDLSDRLLSDLKNETLSKTGTFELWQIIGDLHLKKSNPAAALDAYREAEKILFS